MNNKTLSLSQASLAYSVPKTTLFDHCKREFITQPRGGRKCIFSDAQEKELKEYIVKCSQVFYGLTIKMVRQIAFKFAEQNNLNHKFNRTTQLAGKDWYYSFIWKLYKELITSTLIIYIMLTRPVFLIFNETPKY